MGASDVDDIKERLSAVESVQASTNTLVAVLSNEMAGIKKLLWMILGAIIVGVVGAFITAWVQIPRGDYAPTTPRVGSPQ